MLNYILENRYKSKKLTDNSVMIDTIVTSDLGKQIAYKYNLTNISVLTGFKYIGSLIEEFRKTKEFQFEFGYEESLGFLAHTNVEDKDAVSSTLIIVEMINYYNSENKSLLDVLKNIYEEFGYYQNTSFSISLEGKNPKEKTDLIKSYFNNSELKEIISIPIIKKYDFLAGKVYENNKAKGSTNLDKTDCLKLVLEDESWIAIRPSGTEPKLKFYLASKGESMSQAQDKLRDLKEYIDKVIDQLF